jgi:hypothetical protein
VEYFAKIQQKFIKSRFENSSKVYPKNERLSKLQGLVRPEGLGKFKKNSLHRVSNPRHSGL